jgi:catechol 2,3-dioxygenase-like lactoylglutathione lyase family enzyme
MTQAPTDPPILDHVVADVHDRMDEAVGLYRRLGFHMTPRGKHTLGSINHLAIFADNYFELLGFEKGAAEVRADIMRFPVGLNGLVFRSEDSAATYDAMRRNGVEIQEPLAFHRPVDLAGGGREDARFRVVRLPPGTIAGGRLYFCQHLTKHLVWRDEWRSHPNGAVNIAGVTMVAPDPATVAALFRKMFGAAAVHDGASGMVLELANARVEILAAEGLVRRFGTAAPDPAGRGEYLAALTVRTSAIARTVQALAGFPGVAAHPGRVVVDAAQAFNVTLEFVE